MTKAKSFAVVAGLAGTIALAASASAAPVTSHALALKNAAPNSDIVQVRSRGHRGHWHGAGVAAGIGFGFAAGTILGAAAATSPYYYDDAYVYAPAPVYGYAPGYAWGPGVFAGPYPRSGYEYYTNQPANPTLGTTYGASVTD